MKNQTRGEDTLKTVMTFVNEKEIPLDIILCLCVWTVHLALSANTGDSLLLSEQLNRPLWNFRCLVHQESLCVQFCGTELGNVTGLVLRIVNWILARAFNHRQFQSLLEKVDSE